MTIALAAALVSIPSPAASAEPSTPLNGCRSPFSGYAAEESRPRHLKEGKLFALEAAASVIPHPEKVAKGGEDAFFITRAPPAVGVADGVGGWASSGVDPAVFSKKLMRYTEEFLAGLGSNELAGDSPVQALRSALDRIVGERIPGSSTATVGVIREQMLDVVNVGDSGLLVIRPMGNEQGSFDLVYRTKDQLHGFNFPFQLGAMSRDSPEKGERDSVVIQPNDYIVVASDGLFDNVFDEEIVKFIQNNAELSLQELSDKLAKEAYKRSLSPSFKSPFAVKAAESRKFFSGGKSDDITVVIAKVKIASHL